MNAVLGLAVDPGQNKLYFTNFDKQKLEVSNLDGTERADVVSAIGGFPNGIAIDLEQG